VPRTCRDVRPDQVLVVLHSVLSDQGVISAAEQLVAGDAQLRFLRVVPRAVPYTLSMFRQPLPPTATPGGGPPVRLVAAGDDMASTILSLTRELKITLLALGEPPGEKSRAELIRKTLSRILELSTAPVLFVPAGAKEPWQPIRRILLVLHLPYPATELVQLAIPLARRTHAELMILALPSAVPFIPDGPPGGIAQSSLVFRPFDAGVWLERECARQGCRARPVSADGQGAKVILERASSLEADLVVADAGLADLRVGWRRKKVLDQLFPLLPCPLLLRRCA
jgi:hypothetical protein